jgi:hypothetical protein
MAYDKETRTFTKIFNVDINEALLYHFPDYEYGVDDNGNPNVLSGIDHELNNIIDGAIAKYIQLYHPVKIKQIQAEAMDLYDKYKRLGDKEKEVVDSVLVVAITPLEEEPRKDTKK